MKKLHIFFLTMMIISGFVFAEDIKVKTGDVFGSSMTDYFTPIAKGIRGSWICVSSIKNIVDSKTNQMPKTFEYYVRPGDVISVCRFPDIQREVQLKVKSIKWNEAVLEIVE